GRLGRLLRGLRGDDLVRLVAEPGRGEGLFSTLRRYRIRVKVEIEIDERPLWVVMGEGGHGGWSGDRSGALDADLSWPAIGRTLGAGEKPDIPVGSVGQFEGGRIRGGEPVWG